MSEKNPFIQTVSKSGLAFRGKKILSILLMTRAATTEHSYCLDSSIYPTVHSEPHHYLKTWLTDIYSSQNKDKNMLLSQPQL